MQVGTVQDSSTCTLNQGQQLVVASAGVDWSLVRIGWWFKLLGDAQPWYTVGSAPTEVNGRWQLNLTGNYLAASNPAASYVIIQDYTDDGQALVGPADTEKAAIQRRNATKISSNFTGLRQATQAALATIPQPGTTAGTYAAGDDYRLTATVVLTGLSTAAGVDNAPVLQAAINALPASGGTIIKPRGRYLVNSTVNVDRTILWRGNSRSQDDAFFINDPTGTMFNVTGGRTAFENMCLVHTSNQASAGYLIRFQPGGNDRAHLTGCTLLGGYIQVQCLGGELMCFTDCEFNGCRKYALEIANIYSPDAGDHSVIGCVFCCGSYTLTATEKTAAIHYRSSGGLKVANTKIVGAYPGTPSTQFSYGVWLQHDPNSATSIFEFIGSSIENVNDTGIRQDLGVAEQATFGKIIIGLNEFFNMQTGISIGNFSSGVNHSSRSLSLPPNVFTDLTSAIQVNGFSGGNIATQHYNNVTNLVNLTGNNVGIQVDPQYRTDGSLGYVVNTTQSDAAGGLVNFSTRANLFYDPGANPPLVRFGLIPFSGATVRVSITGIAAGAGAFHIVMTRSLFTQNGGYVATLIGADVKVGDGQNGVNFGWDTTHGEIRLINQAVNGNGFSANYDVRVDGPLQWLKLGP